MKISTILLSLAFSFVAISSEFNLRERIEANNFYRSSFNTVFSSPTSSNIILFKEAIEQLNEKEKAIVQRLVNELSEVIPSDFLRPLIYWKVISPDRQRLNQTLTFIMVYKSNILRDALQSPVKLEEIEQIKSFIKKIYHRENLNNGNFYGSLIKDFQQKSSLISDFTDLNNFILALKETKPISFTLPKGLQSTPYTLSFSGLIPGNQVSIFHNHATDEERINWYLDRSSKSTSSLKHITMPEKKHSKGHIAFKTDPIFIKVKEMISTAKDSIFISVKHIDGTLGFTTLKFLVEEVEKKLITNKNFKVFILAQNISEPIESLKKELGSKPKLEDSIYLIKTFDAIKENNSKVMVIDANTSSPEALVGSKNWSDLTGGFFFDNDVWIKGPAAAMLQNSFFNDLKAALTQTPSNSRYSNKLSNILESFKIKRNSYPYAGEGAVRIAETDIDGIVKNTRNIIIDMIRSANINIYMEQLYLYDSYIINALIKRKMEVPKLDIRILADNNSNIGLNGLPNTIYLRELNLYNIKVKARRTIVSKKELPNGEIQIFHQENHRNTLSVDGNILLTGSSSLSPSSQQGVTREVGVQIFDKESIKDFENSFLLTWNNRDKVMDLDIENFQVKVKDSTLSKDISSLINAISSTLIKAKDNLKSKF